MPEFYAELVESYVAAQERFYADHDARVSEWYENGDGRPVADGGRGWAFPECIHGTSLWTDYDNICWGCEAGYTYFDADREMAEGYRHVHYAMSQVAVRREQAREMAKVFPGGYFPEELFMSMLNWQLAPLAEFKKDFGLD